MYHSLYFPEAQWLVLVPERGGRETRLLTKCVLIAHLWHIIKGFAIALACCVIWSRILRFNDGQLDEHPLRPVGIWQEMQPFISMSVVSNLEKTHLGDKLTDLVQTSF